jgi:hypothetical protein
MVFVTQIKKNKHVIEGKKILKYIFFSKLRSFILILDTRVFKHVDKGQTNSVK